MHILVVEDHLDSANALAFLLRSGGHAVRIAANGVEALRACGEAVFDLMISDIGLPDVDGWDLLERVRKCWAIPAIALTARGMPEDAQRSRAAGFNAHLTKPLDYHALSATMARLSGPATTC